MTNPLATDADLLAEDSELWSAHADLSAVDLRFRRHALHDDELQSVETFKSLDFRTGFYQFRMQPWPTFVDRRWTRQFAAASVAVSELIHSIPERVFGNDPGALARFYGIDESFARLALEPPTGIEFAVGRGDFVISATGCWCLEFNITACLGGWETGVLGPMVLGVPAIARFIAAERIEVSYRDTVRLLLAHVVSRARASRLAAGEVNSAIIFGAETPPENPFAAFLAREYAAVLAAADPPATGAIVMCGYEQLAVRDQRLWLGDRRLHAAIEWFLGDRDPAIWRCFKAGNLDLYDGPIAAPLSDKRTLALLSERAESSVFTAGQRRIIRSHIPWTRCLQPGETSFHGEKLAIEDLVLARRDSLVLKKGDSMGGEAVVIGRFAKPDDWRSSLEATLAAGDWIVQEYVESLPFLFHDGTRGSAPHDVVWGPFVFGQTYAGTILRLQPKALGGIVNLSRNATEGILLEIADGRTASGSVAS